MKTKTKKPTSFSRAIALTSTKYWFREVQQSLDKNQNSFLNNRFKKKPLVLLIIHSLRVLGLHLVCSHLAHVHHVGVLKKWKEVIVDWIWCRSVRKILVGNERWFRRMISRKKKWITRKTTN
jgi:hypothetical protein